MLKKVFNMIICVSFVFALAGCLYPEERKTQNQIPYEDQLVSVQKSVDDFLEDQGVLPIMNRDEDTPIYQKYPIDFRRLIPRYIQEPPGNAFESGGIYQYVLVNVEENPTVKLIDLRVVDAIQDYQFTINQYKRENKYIPFGKVLDKNLFQLNHSALGYDSIPQVESAITGNHLPFIVNGQGEIFVDYSQDLYKLIEEHDLDLTALENEDIRHVIVDHSPFVPVFSVPYTVKDGKPVFLAE